MIFSLLNVNKKTAAVLAGIVIAATCLWGIAMWQDISIAELLRLFVAVVVMLGAIIVAALAVIVAFKLLVALSKRLLPRQGEPGDSD